MLARVSLLFIASALFAGAWISDAQYQGEGVAKKQPVAVVPMHPVRQRWLDSAPVMTARVCDFRGCYDPSAVHEMMSGRRLNTIGFRAPRAEADEIPIDSIWMFGDCDITLPRDIGEGTYRAVNDRGEERVIDLDDEKLAYHGILAGAPRRDLYVTDDADARWYFIRQKPAAPRIEIARESTVRNNFGQSASWSNSAAAVLEVAAGRVLGTAGAPLVEMFADAGIWARAKVQQLAMEWMALLRRSRSWAEMTIDWIHAPYDTVEPASRLATGADSKTRR
jgi:hypothetical protein